MIRTRVALGAPETRYLRVGPHRLRVLVHGTGAPLLLLNGLGGRAESWDPFVAQLPGRQLIALDMPGSGGSSRMIVPRPMFAYARMAATVLRKLGHRQVDVLGLSWGGAVAQVLAVTHPWLVRRVVLCATVPGIPSVPGNPFALPGQVRDTPGFGPPRWDHVSQTLSMLTFTNWTTMGLLRAPTLVMAGDDDPVVPMSNSRILARGIPHATLHVVRNGGHLFLLTRPEASARVVDDFLS